MTRQEFYVIAGYFANPNRNSRIEIEGKTVTLNNYAPNYLVATGLNFPFGSDAVTELDNNADKRGREMRLYFSLTNQPTVPPLITELMTGGGRRGYEQWDRRLNSIDIIDELLTIGFTLGHPQDITRIRALVPAADLQDFDNGFDTP